MKKIYLLSFFMLLPLMASADAVEIDGIYYNLISKAAVAEVTSNPNYYEGDIVIPKSITYDGVEYSVTCIGAYAFQSCVNLNSVIIPNSVTTIDGSAFKSCSSLASLTIPNSVTSIGGCAFEGCSGLSSITIPSSVTSIGQWAFSLCTSLTSITIPDGVSEISLATFHNCTSLTSVTIPNSVMSIGEHAFSGCTSLPSITIPNSVKSIYYYAFKDCSSLASIVIGTGINSIETEAFANCSQLTEVYCYAENVPSTMSNAFDGSYPEYITLYVPAKSVSSFKGQVPWSTFKAVLSIDGDPTEYTLSYVIDGNVYKSYEVEEGAAITPEPAPSKEGYTFSGWNDLPTTMPGYDVTVTGGFTVNKYKLTYMIDGVEYQSYDIEYGSSITPEPAPSKDGYTFSGWSDIPATMPASDLTITGSFNAIPAVSKFKLTYMVDDEVYNSYELEEGTIVNPEPAPSKEGYTFSGWNDLPTTMPGYDVTVTGSFTVNKYKLTYMIDGVEYQSYDIEYGSSITPEPAPSKDGYSFSGWSDIPATMPAYDIVIEGFYTTGITNTQIIDRPLLIYSINGNRVSQPINGLNIIRFENGKTKKVIHK